jgi:hypothetical protein
MCVYSKQYGLSENGGYHTQWVALTRVVIFVHVSPG